MDKGLSVRKRVITISQKICQQTDNPIVPKILLAMAPRIYDEEQSIKDLVIKIFEGIKYLLISFSHFLRTLVQKNSFYRPN